MNLLGAKLDLLYRYVFFSICHPGHLKQPALGNNPFPLCYRETGIFVGFLIGFVLLVLLYPHRRGELPRKWFLVGVAGAFVLMAVDGVGSYSGSTLSTNATRLATGLLVGFGISSLMVPVLNDAVWRDASFERVLIEPRKLAYWSAAIPVAFAAVWIHPIGIGYLMPHLALAAVLLLLVVLNLFLLSAAPFFKKIESGLAQLAPWLGVAAALAVVEVVLMGLMHAGMHG